jgi:hypothetical protein
MSKEVAVRALKLLHQDNEALVNEYERVSSASLRGHREKFYTEDKEALMKIKEHIKQNEAVIRLIENYYGFFCYD